MARQRDRPAAAFFLSIAQQSAARAVAVML